MRDPGGPWGVNPVAIWFPLQRALAPGEADHDYMMIGGNDLVLNPLANDSGIFALIDRFEGELQPLSDEQLDLRPETSGWTARECIGHLTVTAELYNEKLAALLANPSAKRGAGARKPNWTPARES